ncbi:MAG: ribonuclease activity regulator RraA [Alphaproteobacteria bacterium]|nr:ribonuclease activity regulator RraA [Alphaproteobacteria bacterium]
MAGIDQKTIELIRTASTASITGYLYKKHGMRIRAVAGVSPLNAARCRFAGPAFTMRYVPQREDLNTSTDLGSPTSVVLAATESIARGDVLVLDMLRDASVGALGDVLTTRFIDCGVAGVVADGGMRDVRELRDMSLPIFCAGAAAPPSPCSLMAIAIQQPIACGGVVVFPGDLIVGDEDGVVVVPAHLARETAEQAAEKEIQDNWTRRLVAGGGGIRGRYPPDAAHLEMYKRWRSDRKP